MLGQLDRMPHEFIDEYYGTDRNFKLFAFRALHDKEAENELKTVHQAWETFHADAVVIREAATLEFSDRWNLLEILR
jgi:hypothetical protein